MSQQPSKKEKREAARSARVEAQRAREKARKRKKNVLLALLVIGALLLGAFGVNAYLNGKGKVKKDTAAAGCVDKEFKELNASPHLEPSAPVPDYNSNPPTSGLHFDQTAPWGTSDETIEDRMLVHNLEHGGLAIHYKDLPDDDVDALVDFVEDTYEDGVIAHPNDQIKSTIAIAAWGHLRTCESYNQNAVRAFIKARCNKGPEKQGLKCAA